MERQIVLWVNFTSCLYYKVLTHMGKSSAFHTGSQRPGQCALDIMGPTFTSNELLMFTLLLHPLMLG